MEPGESHDALIAANAAFYHALEARDIDLMDRLWLHEGWVRCVHPGWDAVSGWAAVRASFKEIFAAPRWFRVTATSIDVLVFGDIGVIACVENITTHNDGDLGMTAAQATNIFRLTAGGWRMMHHHASPAPMHVTQAYDGHVQ
jgi:ketosteroid isomerase-like protein